MQLIFGIGALWGARTDVANIGPDQFAILQDNSVDFSFEVKELYSQLQFPVDIARGKGKITGKAKMARVFGALYADLFFGATTSTGETTVSQDELHTIPATGTYTVAVTNLTGYVGDLGVYYASSSGVGGRFSYVTGALSVAATYNETAGTYTFDAADAGKQVQISYVTTLAVGLSIPITNNYMGYTPVFEATFYQSRTTQGASGALTLRLNACVSSHLTFPSRIDDYGIPDFDYQAFSPTGVANIGTLSTSE